MLKGKGKLVSVNALIEEQVSLAAQDTGLGGLTDTSVTDIVPLARQGGRLLSGGWGGVPGAPHSLLRLQQSPEGSTHLEASQVQLL